MTERNTRVFCGGTCNDSNWRDRLIPLLDIEAFNPVVPNWTPECQAEELKQREECDFCLYVITPNLVGVYSIAEVADDSNKRPKKTVFAYLTGDTLKDGTATSFDKKMIKSLQATGDLVARNGGMYFENRGDDEGTLKAIAEWLNTK